MCELHNSAALRKVPCQTQLLLSSSCWVRQQCFVFRGLQIFDFSQQQVLKSSALWQSIVGWESSRKSSGCLPEPRGSRCPSFSNSLSLSLSLSLDFSSIWEKYAKAHHSLNSHISSSYIQPKVRGEENWTNWEQQIYPKVLDLSHCLLNTIIQMNISILKLEDE